MEDLINCAIAYRKAGNAAPLYHNREEVKKQWSTQGAGNLIEGARQDMSMYPDLFKGLPYDLAVDMTPLNSKETIR